MALASWWAYDIRLYAIRVYGYVIHEFDPWFNYRATEYLDEHGWHALVRGTPPSLFRRSSSPITMDTNAWRVYATN